MREERIQTVIIGAGQSGLSVGYHLARPAFPLSSSRQISGLATPGESAGIHCASLLRRAYDGLVGNAVPAASRSFPTKDAMADYLEAYAKHFKLPVRTGVTVTRLTKHGSGFLVLRRRIRDRAENVVVAMSDYQQPRIPAFAKDLDPSIVQLHSREYRNPAQLRKGCGAGSGSWELGR